jgi:hypothetical protein
VRTDLNYLLFDGERERMLNHMMFGGERSSVDGLENDQGPKEHTLFFTIFLFVSGCLFVSKKIGECADILRYGILYIVVTQ